MTEFGTLLLPRPVVTEAIEQLLENTYNSMHCVFPFVCIISVSVRALEVGNVCMLCFS